MSMKYKLEDFNTDMTADWSSIEDGGDARKIEISIFNPFVPTYYKNRVNNLLNNFIEEYNITNPIKEICSVSGVILSFIDKKVALDKKYSILFFIYLEENGEKEDSFMFEDPILSSDDYFAEFKECVMKELENLCFCQ